MLLLVAPVLAALAINAANAMVIGCTELIVGSLQVCVCVCRVSCVCCEIARLGLDRIRNTYKDSRCLFFLRPSVDVRVRAHRAGGLRRGGGPHIPR